MNRRVILIKDIPSAYTRETIEIIRETLKEIVSSRDTKTIFISEEELRNIQIPERIDNCFKSKDKTSSSGFLEKMIRVGSKELGRDVVNKEIKVVHNLSVVVKDGKTTIKDLS